MDIPVFTAHTAFGTSRIMIEICGLMEVGLFRKIATESILKKTANHDVHDKHEHHIADRNAGRRTSW